MAKEFKDTIHNYIQVSELAMQIIQTPEFEFLSQLKQLAHVNYVFCTANHTRKEHSIGVYHLSGKYLDHLEKNTLAYSESMIRSMTPRIKEMIKIAGLIHDIGHVAFSHFFDDYFAEDLKIPHHEERGIQIFRGMVTKYKLPFTTEEVDFICTIVIGKMPESKGSVDSILPLPWMMQIVSNHKFELDADKLDYLMRDAYYTGIENKIQVDRIFNHCRINLDGNIVFSKKVVLQLYDVFMARYRMHKEVYRHKTVLSVGMMIKKYMRSLLKIDEVKKMLANEEWSFFSDDVLFAADKFLSMSKFMNPEWLARNMDAINECVNIRMDLTRRKIPKLVSKKMCDGDIPVDTETSITVKLSLCSSGINPLNNFLFYDKNGVVERGLDDFSMSWGENLCENITFSYK